MHFKAKHLAYIPKVWHHFITSRLISTTNVCKVTAKLALLNFIVIQDIPFDVGQIIEDDILYNRDAKMNLVHPFLIYGLFKNPGVPLKDNEAGIHPIKAIVLIKDKLGVPRSDAIYDSGDEPSEEELTAYQTLFGMSEETPGEADHPLLRLPLNRLSPVLCLPLRTRFRTSLPSLMRYGMRPKSIGSP